MSLQHLLLLPHYTSCNLHNRTRDQGSPPRVKQHLRSIQGILEHDGILILGATHPHKPETNEQEVCRHEVQNLYNPSSIIVAPFTAVSTPTSSISTTAPRSSRLQHQYQWLHYPECIVVPICNINRSWKLILAQTQRTPTKATEPATAASHAPHGRDYCAGNELF